MPTELLRQSIEFGQGSAAAPAAALVSAPAGIAITSLAGSLLYANDAFRELFGLGDIASVRNEDVRRLTGGVLSEEFLLPLAREGGQRQKCVSAGDEDGHRELLCTVKRVMHGALPIYLAVVVQDISDLAAHHRQQLLEMMELLDAQSVVRSCSWSMHIADEKDIGNNSIVWASRVDVLFGAGAVPRMFGDYVRCIVPACQQRVVAAVATAVALRGEYSVDYFLRTADGSKRRMRSVGRCVDDAVGACRRLIGTNRDITAQDDIDESASVRGWLLEHMDMPVVLLDRRGRYRYFNPAFAALVSNRTGAAPQPGASVLHAVSDPLRRRLLADALTRVMKGEEPVFESGFVDERGEMSRWVDFRFRPLRDASGTIEGAMVLGCDVSPLKRANIRHQHLNAEIKQRLERRTAEIDATNRDLLNRVAGACDELREGLRDLQGSISATLGSTPGDMSLQQVAPALATLESRIDELSRLSDVGLRIPERRSIDMNRLVHEVRQDLAMLLQGRALEFDVDRLPGIVADRALVRQVFHNLLSNAVKFTRGSHAARIRVWAEEEDGTLVWSVADSGVGFDMKEIDSMFSAFARHGRKPRGVGLAVAWRAVQQLNGRIWCESSPGQGAIFHCTLGDHAEEAHESRTHRRATG